MNYYIRLFLLISIVILSSTSFAQLKEKKGVLAGLTGDFTVNGYIDTYIAYDNDKNSTPRQFSAIAPYRDEFRLNFAMISLRYNTDKLRGNVAIHFGDVSKLNWTQEENEYLQYVQEANMGFSPSKNLWIDAGFFLTHIGGEGIIPKYNFFQSLSLCTYYEPFYQSGIKVSYTGKKFYGSLFLLNGYNVFNDNNKNKSFGVQLGYKPNKKIELIYNNIIGNEMPAGVTGKTRIYNNLVLKLWPAKNIDVIACGDFCIQDQSGITDSTSSGSMFSGFVSARLKILKNFSVALRGEIFRDKDGIFSGIVTEHNNSYVPPSGLKATGFSGAVEYNPTDISYFRLESRLLITDTDQKIFYNFKYNRIEVILSGGIEF